MMILVVTVTGEKLHLLKPTANPFPAESFCQHDSVLNASRDIRRSYFHAKVVFVGLFRSFRVLRSVSFFSCCYFSPKRYDVIIVGLGK